MDRRRSAGSKVKIQDSSADVGAFEQEEDGEFDSEQGEADRQIQQECPGGNALRVLRRARISYEEAANVRGCTVIGHCRQS